MDRFDAGPQPSGRAPAPGRLAYVQAFCNSFWRLDGDGDDAWADDAGFADWMGARGFRGGDGRARAVELREALRTLFLAHNRHGSVPAAERALDALGAPAALLPRVGGGALEPAGDTTADACALALGIVLVARADGSLQRMKACPHEHCGWVFHDTSRNRSGQWCSMRICGNRTKGAAFRARRRAEENASP
jgi:predicted RNA-binding Zn ribbon-like protein